MCCINFVVLLITLVLMISPKKNSNPFSAKQMVQSISSKKVKGSQYISIETIVCGSGAEVFRERKVDPLQTFLLMGRKEITVEQ